LKRRSMTMGAAWRVMGHMDERLTKIGKGNQ
jgi:hypothetical protein